MYAIRSYYAVSIPHFTDNTKDRVIGHVFEFADQLRKDLGTFSDNFLNVLRDFSAKCQKDIRILI